MADERRVGEDNKRKHFRADRISVSNGKFYFTTREGTLEGPFVSKADAEGELVLYIRKMSGRDIYGAATEKKSPT